jgi:cytochrome b561
MAEAVAPAGSTEAIRYTRVAVWLHWTIAAFILFNLAVGWGHDLFPKPAAASLMSLHKASGLTVIALALVRLAWRLTHRPPPYDPVMKAWEVLLARITHWLFYLLMVAAPLTGWLMVSANGRSTSWFGLFAVGPLPVGGGDEAHDIYEDRHELIGWILAALIVLHLLGALKHQLQGHRHLFGRMAPWFYREA